MTLAFLSALALLVTLALVVAAGMRYRLRRPLGSQSPDADEAPASAFPPGATPLRPVKVSVVVPAINEEGCIGWVLGRMPDWVYEVVLVDGCSIDGTEMVARSVFPNIVVVHQSQPGKGAALRAGFAAATGDVIATLDADGSTNPAELGRFVQALQAGAEFVKGSRHVAGGGSRDITLLRALGNRMLVALTNLVHGCRFTDLCYGYCAFWRRDLDALILAADGFEVETELILSAVRAGLRVHEIPSVELQRLAGVSNLHALRDGRRVLETILSQRPGSAARRSDPHPKITLMPAEVASPGSPEWVPAGKDQRRSHRRSRERRAAARAESERRRTERRRNPLQTVTVYRAIETQVLPGTVPADGGGAIARSLPAAEEPTSATVRR